MKCYSQKKSGFALLIGVMIISAVTLSIALGVGLVGITGVQTSLFINKASQALNYADSCAEEAYYRLKLNNSYQGGTLSFGNESCTVSIQGNGSARTITAFATVDNFTRTINIQINLTVNNAANAHNTDITEWQ